MKTFQRLVFLSVIIFGIVFTVSCKKNTQTYLTGKWDRVNVAALEDTVFFETWEFTSDGKLFIACSGYANYIDSLDYKGELTYDMDSRNKFTVSKDRFSDQWEIVLRKDNKLRIVHNYGEDQDIQQGLDEREFVKL
ncbi:MAG TPA: hypothetical protein PKL96_05205 [Bacteroidales bacterium]|nr:hypothetical protein [Bacteroidales bacterium]HPS27178.1 hypothetical protein [Bacteroidales bacterium]HQN17453.1 hypothetical protein [Bacteroidales bacterium]